MVEGFNNFFVRVGPNMAKEIIPPHKGGDSKSLIDRNPATIFLWEVTKNEIIDIVNRFKSKTSLDWNGIDMTLIKKVISNIADPLTTSALYHSDWVLFLVQWRLLKSYLYIKQETNICIQTIGQFHCYHSFWKSWRNSLWNGWIVLLKSISYL